MQLKAPPLTSRWQRTWQPWCLALQLFLCFCYFLFVKHDHFHQGWTAEHLPEHAIKYPPRFRLFWFLFELLPSGWRYRALSTRITRHSFFPQAIHLMNIWTLDNKHETHNTMYLFNTHTYYIANIHLTYLNILHVYFVYCVWDILHIVYFVYLYIIICIICVILKLILILILKWIMKGCHHHISKCCTQFHKI